MSEIQFVEGLVITRPDNAPEYVTAKVWIPEKAKLIAFLQKQPGDEVRMEIKRAKSGKYYAALDTWKPSEKPKGGTPPRQQVREQNPAADDLIPF